MTVRKMLAPLIVCQGWKTLILQLIPMEMTYKGEKNSKVPPTSKCEPLREQTGQVDTLRVSVSFSGATNTTESIFDRSNAARMSATSARSPRGLTSGKI